MNPEKFHDIFESADNFVEKGLDKTPTEEDLIMQGLRNCKTAHELRGQLLALSKTLKRATHKRHEYLQLLSDCEILENCVESSSFHLNIEKVLTGQATESDYALGARLQKEPEALQHKAIALLQSLKVSQK